MKRLLKKLLLKLNINITKGSKYKYESHGILELYQYKNDIEDFNNMGIKFRNNSKFLDFANFRFVIKGFPIWRELQSEAKAELEFFENKKEVLVKIDGQEFYVQTFEEFVILKEVFIDGIYNIITPKTFCFIDIGMNVAFTSLFMSKNPNAKSVYSYEPFIKTFNQGLRNIQLNISSKINAHSFGLGKCNEILLLDYTDDFRGSMGIAGIPFYLQESIIEEEISKQRVEIRDIAEVLIDIQEKEGEIGIVLKMDCEGSEYDLISRLAEVKLLTNIKVLMIEWHLKGPKEIEKILKENDFYIFSFSPLRKDISMIYAVKN